MANPIAYPTPAAAVSAEARFCQSCGCNLSSPKAAPTIPDISVTVQDNGDCTPQATTRHVVYAIIVVCVLVGYVIREGLRTRETLRALNDFTGTTPQVAEPVRASARSGGYSEGRFLGGIDRNKASNKHAPSSLSDKDRAYFMAAYPVSPGTKEYGDFWSGYQNGYYDARN